jgi:hypothetical protein
VWSEVSRLSHLNLIPSPHYSLSVTSIFNLVHTYTTESLIRGQRLVVLAAENLPNKIFCLGLVREEKPPGRQEKACRFGRKSLPARPMKAGTAWPLRNTGLRSQLASNLLKCFTTTVRKIFDRKFSCSSPSLEQFLIFLALACRIL